MKNWTWKEWVAFAMVLIVIVAEVISVFVAPWAALLGAGIGVFAFVAGWIAGKHITFKKSEK